MKKFTIIFLVLVVYSQPTLIAQFSLNSKHNVELEGKHDVLLNAIPVIELPEFDNDKLLRDYSISDTISGIKPILAKGVSLDKYLMYESLKQEISDNYSIYRLRIKSNSALGLHFKFGNFELVEGEELMIFDLNSDKKLGAYTYLNNKKSKVLSTKILYSNDVVIQFISKNSKLSKNLIIKNISHVFDTRFEFGNALNCHNDVNCDPWVTEWCNEIRSVVQLLLFDENGDGALCSGSILNNSENSFDPLIFTAQHCIDFDDADFDPDATIVIYNFQSPTCDPIQNGNDRLRSTDGVNVVEFDIDGNNCPDNALLRVVDTNLPDQIPINYNVFYTGWSVEEHDEEEEITVIHHPAGDIKKITFGEINNVTNNCYRAEYNNGITEPGSSGSPMFNNNNQVIAALSHRRWPHNGDVECGDNINVWFGRLSSNDFFDNIRNELTPGSTTINQIGGADPFDICLEDIDIYGNLFPAFDWQNHNAITIQSSNSITAAVNNIQTTIRNSMHANLGNNSDYTFRAGSSITLLPGFTAEAGNRFKAEIGDCLDFTGCGFNYQEVDSDDISARDANNPKHNQLVVYPNPNNGYFTIEFDIKQKDFVSAELWIYDLTGKLMYNSFIKNGKRVFTFDDIPSGLYLISFRFDNKLYQEKLIVK